MKKRFKMASTLLRSFLKGFVWEFISFLVVIVAVYLVYGDLRASIKFSFVLTLVKIPLFFFHERIWKMIRWGKYRYSASFYKKTNKNAISRKK